MTSLLSIDTGYVFQACPLSAKAHGFLCGRRKMGSLCRHCSQPAASVSFALGVATSATVLFGPGCRILSVSLIRYERLSLAGIIHESRYFIDCLVFDWSRKLAIQEGMGSAGSFFRRNEVPRCLDVAMGSRVCRTYISHTHSPILTTINR